MAKLAVKHSKNCQSKFEKIRFSKIDYIRIRIRNSNVKKYQIRIYSKIRICVLIFEKRIFECIRLYSSELSFNHEIYIIVKVYVEKQQFGSKHYNFFCAMNLWLLTPSLTVPKSSHEQIAWIEVFLCNWELYSLSIQNYLTDFSNFRMLMAAVKNAYLYF